MKQYLALTAIRRKGKTVPKGETLSLSDAEAARLMGGPYPAIAPARGGEAERSLDDSALNAAAIARANGETLLPPKPVEEQGDMTVSINDGSQAELVSLKYIGNATAKKIIDGRSQQPYSSLEQAKEVAGLSDAAWNEIAGRLTL
jgi:DNA uptake protein ComE-like DNA-binding protein